MHDAIIVGGGAAGLSAALILGRARRRVLLFDDGHPRNAVAPRMQGFLTRDGERPGRFLQIARAELKRYPTVRIISEAVASARRSDGRFVATSQSRKRFTSKKLILANGVRDQLPEISGLSRFWGRSVFVCPFCEGWEVRNKRVAVYGESAKVVGLAQELYGWTKRLVAIVDQESAISSKQRRWLKVTSCRLICATLVRLRGRNGLLDSLELSNGESVRCDALFLAAPLRQATAIPRSLGCKTDPKGAIVVDDCNRTTVQGCYAAGDAVTEIHQVVLAAASGARAAISMCKDLLSEEARSRTA